MSNYSSLSEFAILAEIALTNSSTASFPVTVHNGYYGCTNPFGITPATGGFIGTGSPSGKKSCY
jgi:hypothetical protein